MGEFVGQCESPAPGVQVTPQVNDCSVTALYESTVLDHVRIQDLVDAHVRRECLQVDRGSRRDPE